MLKAPGDNRRMLLAADPVRRALRLGARLLVAAQDGGVQDAVGQGLAAECRPAGGAGGGKTFISRFTVILAVSFMCTSLFLALFKSKDLASYKGVLKNLKQTEAPAAVPAEALPAEKPAAE